MEHSGPDHEGRIGALEKDMWRGNGKPGVTTRLSQNEDAIATLKHDLRNARQDTLDDCVNINRRIDTMETSVNNRLDKTDKKFNTIIILLITVLAGLVTSMVMEARSQPQQRINSSMY